MRRTILVGVALSLAAVGCAGVPPAQIGQTAGTLAGGALAPGVGAPVGALVGLLAGMLIQGEMDRVMEQRERQTLGDELRTTRSVPSGEASAPAQGEPSRVWIDETVDDGRLIAGHFDVRQVP